MFLELGMATVTIAVGRVLLGRFIQSGSPLDSAVAELSVS